MKFMTLVKTSSTSKATTPPTRELMEGIMKLGVEAGPALVEQGGLMDIDKGASVRLVNDEVIVVDGPFTESKEWVGGYAVYKVTSKAEAIGWAVKFVNLHKQFWPGWEGDVEIRQIFEAPGA